MKGYKNRRIHIRAFYTFMVLVLCGIIGNYFVTPVRALELYNRSILLSSSFAGEQVVHNFSFDLFGNSTVGSIQFEYCSNSPLFIDPCTAPAGLNVSGAGVLSESGMTGFSMSGATTNNSLVISRPPAAETPVSANYLFDNIINPTTVNEIVFVRISLFDGINGTGTRVDQGAVVFVVDDRYDIDAYVPPYLTFCVGVTVALDCSTTTGFLADFGEFSEFSATAVTTQMSGSTNDGNGYNVFVSGQTLTSGANVIPNLIANTASQPGTSQFGINLRANTNPSVGSNPQAGPVAAGAPSPNYNSPNLFRFVSGERVAGSTTATGYNRYTVSYLVNVSQDQRPGIYAATLTYTSIASF